MPSDIVNVAIATFYALEGDTFNEKKKSFRAYLKNLSLSSLELDEFGRHLLTDKPCVFTVDILLHFKMHRHILEVIKSCNGPLVGRILKDWTFFKNIFTYITPDELVNSVLPLLSFTIRMKIINRICKTLTDELVADRLFESLDDKYGITTASVLIPACSTTLIKSIIVKYDLKVSGRQLWAIYKKDQTIIDFYFAHHAHVMNEQNLVNHAYKWVMKKISNTNSVLFWELAEKYKTPLKIGKHSSKKLFTNRDVLLKYARKNDSRVTFPKSRIFQAAVKLGIQKEYLLSFYPDSLDDFLTKNLKTVPSLQNFVPRDQRLTITNTLFKEKYSDDLFNYPKHFKDETLLEVLTVSEREAILDKLDDKDDLLYFYSPSKAIPMLKEKFESESIFEHGKLILMLFKNCNVNNDINSLLDLLNRLYDRYITESPSFLADFFNSILSAWKKFKLLKRQHWEVIHKILNRLIGYGGVDKTSLYFEEYFKYLIDNNESTEEFLETYVRECLNYMFNMQVYHFDSGRKYRKIFYDRMMPVLKVKNRYSDYNFVAFNFLENIVNIDKKYPASVNLADYLFILDICDNLKKNYDTIFVHILNKYGVVHKNIQNYYSNPKNFTIGFYNYCINKSPKDLLNVNNVYASISRLTVSKQPADGYFTRCSSRGMYREWKRQHKKPVKKKTVNIFDLIKCPYFQSSLDSFKEIALSDINSDCKVLTRSFSTKFICLLDENEFVYYSERYVPTLDGTIPTDFDGIIRNEHDRIRLYIQKCIIKCLPLVSYPSNLTILMKYCKGDYVKFCLPSLHKILFGVPMIHLENVLGNMYNSEVCLRRHSLYLGRFLVPPNAFNTLLEIANKQDNDFSVQFAILKKTLEYFIETHDDKFYRMFLEKLDKIDFRHHTVFNYLINYNKIPKLYLTDYIKQIYRRVCDNSDASFRIDKKSTVLNSIPDYLFENLDAAFITWCFEVHFFDMTPFIVKYLLNSKSENHYQLIFDKFNTFLSGDIRCTMHRGSITKFVHHFVDRILQMKAADKFAIFYLNCRQAFPQHNLINNKFLVDFTQKWFESQEDLKLFALKVNNYLIDTVKLYPYGIIGVYCDQLKVFLRKVPIDEFKFLQIFFYTNSVDETYIAAINFLPNEVPSLENDYRKYVPLLEALKKNKTPMVLAHFDLYYGSIKKINPMDYY